MDAVVVLAVALAVVAAGAAGVATTLCYRAGRGLTDFLRMQRARFEEPVATLQSELAIASTELDALQAGRPGTAAAPSERPVNSR